MTKTTIEHIIDATKEHCGDHVENRMSYADFLIILAKANRAARKDNRITAEEISENLKERVFPRNSL